MTRWIWVPAMAGAFLLSQGCMQQVNVSSEENTARNQELEFSKALQLRADRGDIPQSAVPKILNDNARAFYAL